MTVDLARPSAQSFFHQQPTAYSKLGGSKLAVEVGWHCIHSRLQTSIFKKG
jgi:hypothetical protein